MKREEFVEINEVPTRIITWGKWITEPLDDDTKEIIICVTGNPGVPGFYVKFLETIYKELDGNIPVWIIAHAGHEETFGDFEHTPWLIGNHDLYNLDGQLKHKIEFIEKYVPKNVKIHLIGHSIGSWLILQLLKIPRINDQVKKSYMLFPTMEEMRETSNGKLFSNYAVPLQKVIVYLLSLLILLPLNLRAFLISIYLWFASIPRFQLKPILNYLRPRNVERIIFMAKDEMDRVRNLDEDIIKENVGKLKFFYGATDGWVPVSYYNRLKERIPNADAILDTEHISHAFILKSSIEVGKMVGNWIKEDRKK